MYGFHRCFVVALGCFVGCAATDAGSAKSISLPEPGTSNLSVNVLREPFVVRSVTYAPSVDANGKPLIIVLLSSQANLCASLQQGQQLTPQQSLSIILFQTSAEGVRIAPTSKQTFVVSPLASPDSTAALAQVSYAQFSDGTCVNTLQPGPATAHSGDVGIIYYNGPGAPLWGTLDVKLGTQNDLLSGQFTATYCDRVGFLATSAAPGCAVAKDT